MPLSAVYCRDEVSVSHSNALATQKQRESDFNPLGNKERCKRKVTDKLRARRRGVANVRTVS